MATPFTPSPPHAAPCPSLRRRRHPAPIPQDDLYAKARAAYDACLEKVTTWEEFTAALDRKHMVLAPW